MAIRYAQAEDLDGLYAMYKAFFLESRFRNMPMDEDYFLASAREHIESTQSDERCILLAVDDEDKTHCKGFLFGGLSKYPFCQAWEAIEVFFFVHPEYRSGNAGLSLLTAFKRWAEIREAVEIRLSINSGLAEARYAKMLEKMGFRYIGAQYSYPLRNI